MVCHKQPASARDETRIAFVSFRILHLLLSLAAAGRVPPGTRANITSTTTIYFIFHFMQTVSDTTMSRNDVTDPEPSYADDGVAALV